MKKLKVALIVIISIMVLGMVGVNMLNNYYQTIIELSEEEKVEEFQYLYHNLKNDYPFQVETQALGYDLDMIYQTYLPQVKEAKTDILYFKTVERFLHEFRGLGHLSVFDGQTYQLYNDSLQAQIDDENKKEGFAIRHIKAVMEDEMVIRLYSELYTKKDGFRNKRGQKKVKETVVDDSNGGLEKANVQTELLDDGKVAYIKIDSFLLEHYKKDEPNIDDFLTTIGECRGLIIDVSNNPGGSDSYWKDLIVKKIANRPLKSSRYFLANDSNKALKAYVEGASGKKLEDISMLPIGGLIDENLLGAFSSYFAIEDEVIPYEGNNFDGEIFVITGTVVYSSSDNFVQFSKNSGFATIIGQNTSGDGGLDPYLFVLPKSGLIVRYSAVHGIGNDGSNTTLNGSKPDVYIDGDGYVEDAIEYVLERW